MPLSLSRVSRGQQTGQAGPQCAVPKPGPCPKFALPSLVTPCPFLLPAQACTPTPAVTHVSARTMSSEKTFQGWLLSQPRRNGSRSELGPEHPRPSLAPQPSVPLPVPRACLVTGARGGASTLLCGMQWGVAGGPHQASRWRLGADSHCGAQRKDQQLDFSNHSSLVLPRPQL